MSVYTHSVLRVVPDVVRQLAWFVAVSVVVFLVPYVLEE